jgi:cell division protein FtsB
MLLRPAKQGSRKPLRWLALGGLLLLAIVVNEVIGGTGYLARREQRRRIDQLAGEVDQLKQENERLTKRIQDLRSDPATIEEMAREQLHLARPGEVVVTLDPKPAANASAK